MAKDVLRVGICVCGAFYVHRSALRKSLRGRSRNRCGDPPTVRDEPTDSSSQAASAAPGAPGCDAYVALTQELKRRGLFVDIARCGRQEAWEAALAEAHIEVRDHRFMAAAALRESGTTPDTTESPSGEVMPFVARQRIAMGD